MENKLFSQPELFPEWDTLPLEQTLDKNGSFVKLKASECGQEGQYPVIDQGAKYISGYVNSKEVLYKGQLPIIIFGDHTRCVKYVDIPFAVGADGTKILTPIHILNPKFYYHYLTSIQIGDLGYRRHYSILKNITIPLPPLKEQERIANKLDSLFDKLDTLRASLDKIPKLLKDFRQQVLNYAVTGKLTEGWREGKELEEWREDKLEELLLAKPRNGFSPKAVDYITEVKSLSLSATTSGKFDPSYVKYLDIPKPSKDSHLWLKFGDILIQRSNSLEYVGTVAIYDAQDYEFIYPDIMMKMQVNDQISYKYLYYYLSTDIAKTYFRQNATGTAGNMPKINQVVVCNTPINVPSAKEQSEIVRRVENLFSKADQIEERYQELAQKIKDLPQALLHKAFKGELVKQLPTDGDARELLEEIKRLKVK